MDNMISFYIEDWRFSVTLFEFTTRFYSFTLNSVTVSSNRNKVNEVIVITLKVDYVIVIA